jgi:hypothetical protein
LFERATTAKPQVFSLLCFAFATRQIAASYPGMFGMQNKKPADISILGKCTMVLALFGPAFNL